MGEFRGGKERRVHERAVFPGAANVTTARGVIACAIVNISRGGMALRSGQAAQPGEFVRLQLSVPNNKGTRAWIDPDAVVVRAQPGPNGVVWGVTFASPDPSRDALITGLVNAAREVEKRLRTGTRTERNEAITKLLAKAGPGQPRTQAPARPAGQTTTRQPAPVQDKRSQTGPSQTGPSQTGPGAIRRRLGTAETPVQSTPASPHRKPVTRETPIPQSQASRELRALYRAALADIERDVKGKPKPKP